MNIVKMTDQQISNTIIFLNKSLVGGIIENIIEARAITEIVNSLEMSTKESSVDKKEVIKNLKNKEKQNG